MFYELSLMSEEGILPESVCRDMLECFRSKLDVVNSFDLANASAEYWEQCFSFGFFGYRFVAP
jgi:hypothetical protein